MAREASERDEARKIFGAGFRVARQRMELTQEQLEKKAGLARNTVSTIENGKSDLDPEKVLAVAAALNMPAKALAKLVLKSTAPALFHILFGSEPPPALESAPEER